MDGAIERKTHHCGQSRCANGERCFDLLYWACLDSGRLENYILSQPLDGRLLTPKAHRQAEHLGVSPGELTGAGQLCRTHDEHDDTLGGLAAYLDSDDSNPEKSTH